jgi:enediyne biosynthesis protein E4
MAAMRIRRLTQAGAACVVAASTTVMSAALIGAGTSAAPRQPHELFVRVTEGRIAVDEGQSRGVAWGDADGDGDLDLYVANSGGQWNFFYRNDGGGRFAKMRGAEVVRHSGNSEGVNWVDIDNDGDLDLFVANSTKQPNFLFRNDRDSGFVRDTSGNTAGDMVTDAESSVMACWADFDRDGNLDAYVVNRDGEDDALYHNTGGGRFERVRSGAVAGNGGNGRTCAVGDIDGDGDADLFVGNAQDRRFLYRNNGSGELTPVRDGDVVADTAYSYGSSFADYDEDGDLDLLVTNIDRPNQLYRNDGRGTFERVNVAPVTTDSGGASKGNVWGDIDNDGHLDLFVANGTDRPNMRNYLYLNLGGGHFERVMQGAISTDADTSAGTAAADYDGDGDLDLFVANWGSNDEENALYRNETRHAGVARGAAWVIVRPEGRLSNRMGIGLEARVKAAIHGRPAWRTRWLYPSTGYGSQSAPELHVGLGDAAVIDSLVLRWPAGVVDTYTRLAVNRVWRAIEGKSLEPEAAPPISAAHIRDYGRR